MQKHRFKKYLGALSLVYIVAFVIQKMIHPTQSHTPFDEGVAASNIAVQCLSFAVQGLIMLICPLAVSAVIAVVVDLATKGKEKTAAGFFFCGIYTILILLMGFGEH